MLACCLLQRHDAGTALGAQLYFWARLFHLPAYAAGIPYLRTLLWVASVVGLASLLAALF